MVSRWPARGGPVVAGGVVYFGAGSWPSEGIYLKAVDAEEGKILWTNETAGSLYLPQPHGGANARSGVSVQGHLVVAGDQLLVPTGRAVPAAFGLSGGELRYFHLQRYGHNRGGSSIAASDSHFFNGGFIFNTESGEMAPGSTGTTALAITPRSILFAAGKEIIQVDRKEMWVQRKTTDRKGKETTKTALNEISRMEIPHPADVLIATSNAVVLGTEGRLSVVELASRKTILSAAVEGNPLDLAVAGGRLYASTDRGSVYCLGEAPGKPEVHDGSGQKQAAGLPRIPAEFSAAAEEIIRKSDIRRGYCVDLGCGDGSLALALALRTELQICAIDPDPENVALARKKLDGAGIQGVRVTVHRSDTASTYPASFANLVVSGRSVREGTGAVMAGEARRLQRPYGGVVCIGKPGAMEITTRGEPEGAGVWTHQYCDPANTNCSADNLRGPLGMLWFTDFGFPMPSRHGRGPAPLFLDGRLFISGLDGLLAADAYNGRKLWEYPLPGILKAYDQDHLMGSAGTGSNICVTGGGVYVRTGGECLRIDPATGKLLARFEAPLQPDGKPGTWAFIACSGGILYGTLADTSHIVKWRYLKGDMRTQFTESILLFALDGETGALKWTYRPVNSIRNNTIAIGRGLVFLIDRPQAPGDRLKEAAEKRRGAAKSPPHPTGVLLALDGKEGRIVWEEGKNIYGTLLAVSEEYGALLMAYQPTRFRLDSEIGGRMALFRASDGSRAWDIQARYESRPVINGRTIYAQPGAWDLLTGIRKSYQFSRSYGCGIPTGSRNLMLFRSATLGYLDLTCNRGTENYGGIRPGCWINAIPAGGLVLMPDASDRCTCSYLIKSSIALQPYGLRPPVISPPGAASREPIQVTLAGDRREAEIHFTLDGSTPTSASRRYGVPIRIAGTATLKARTFRKGFPPSTVSAATFVVDPTLIPPGGSDWLVQDTPGASPPKSDWKVEGGVVEERSNHYLGSATSTDPAMERPGSLFIYKGGGNFKDGKLQLQISSSDDDVLGVAFRIQGRDRYYLWAMDRQRGFHILALKNGSSYRLLSSSSNRYEPNRWYDLEVMLEGPRITVHLDGKKDLEAADSTLERGTFALHAWGCAGAKFRNIRWIPRER